MTSVGQSWPRCARLIAWIVALSTRAIEIEPAERSSAASTSAHQAFEGGRVDSQMALCIADFDFDLGAHRAIFREQSAARAFAHFSAQASAAVSDRPLQDRSTSHAVRVRGISRVRGRSRSAT